MTYEEIKKNMPDEYEYAALSYVKIPLLEHIWVILIYEIINEMIYRARKKDKLRYRYPRGESYLDVIQRLVFMHS